VSRRATRARDRTTVQLLALTAVVVTADVFAILLWIDDVLTIFEFLAIVLGLAFGIAPRWQKWRNHADP
jgi:hypothetical protein